MWALTVLLCFFIITPETLARQNNDTRGVRKQQPRLKQGLTAHTSRLTRNNLHSGGTGELLRLGLSISRDENVMLDLKPNNDLLSSNYQEIEILPSGFVKNITRKKADIPVCWYYGHIVGEENSSNVLMSDCAGEGVEGLIQRQDGKENFVAKAVGETDEDVAVYNLVDEEPVRGSCGVHHNFSEHTLNAHEDDAHTIDTPSTPGRRLLNYNSSLNVVEVALVSDYRYLQARGGAYGRNLSEIANLNVQVLAYVQATYAATVFTRPTSVRLKAQYFFSHGDPYSLALDSNGEMDENLLLAAFTNWTQSLTVTYDHMMLLTYYDIVGTTIGFAHTASVCTNVNTALAEASNTLLQVANTVAHEMGHVLGMYHDGQSGPPDTTACPGSGYVMATINSCPTSGLCSFSSCSIASKNSWTNGVSCLYTWTDPMCSDGIWNGNETGIDCGGNNCPACTTQTGCANNGGCEETCTPVGSSSFVCGCAPPKYLDPISGTACITDVNQCLSSPCSGGGACTNLYGPGGVYTSFTCNCTFPLVLSVIDGVSCHTPNCFDRIKNQNEVMTDCGGVCARPCNCVVSTAAWHYSYDGSFNIGAQGQWRTQWNDTTKYQYVKYGVPVRYLYASSGKWIYDDNLAPAPGYYGIVNSNALTPPSASWQIYNGNTFVQQTLSFTNCANASSTCGNGVVEGGEVCDWCAVYSGGQCLKINSCCDSTCMAPRLRGSSCSDQDSLLGACWDGYCITRGAACDAITSLNCFGTGPPDCAVGTGGNETCGAIPETVFSNSSCDAPFVCYVNCESTQLNGDPPIGAIRGFPCSTPDSSGVYPSVCDGGSDANGRGSTCVPVASLSNYLTQSPTVAPTPPTTSKPTQNPITASPTTQSPTKLPTTGKPTFSPTSSSPTTALPTRIPTTGTPSISPTTASPVTMSPTKNPTTHIPTTLAPTRVPTPPTTLVPTSSPTVNASNVTKAPTTSSNFMGISGLPAEYNYFYYGGAALIIVILIGVIVFCFRTVCCRQKVAAPRLRTRRDDIELDG